MVSWPAVIGRLSAKLRLAAVIDSFAVSAGMMWVAESDRQLAVSDVEVPWMVETGQGL
jgi:hypothetical protein